MSISKIDEKAQRTIAYIRVSSKRQVDDGVSLDAQKRRILEYVKFKGLNLVFRLYSSIVYKYYIQNNKNY